MAKTISKIATKTKQAAHLLKGDTLVLTNQTSKKQQKFVVHSKVIDEADEYGVESGTGLSVRVTIATPELFNEKASRVIGYTVRENVDVLA